MKSPTEVHSKTVTWGNLILVSFTFLGSCETDPPRWLQIKPSFYVTEPGYNTEQ